MNYTLHTSECGRYIHVTYHGAINRALGVQVTQEVETVLQNAGFQVKLFADREQATLFLLRFAQ